MTNDYEDALRRGTRARRIAELLGKSPYLPVLDSFLQTKDTAGEFQLGTMDIPVSMVTGNKTEGRNNSFALNWMPIMDTRTEFALKWSNLCESCKNEGVHDAILCYEYLNHYYAQEGNKRVSVSNYLGIESIPAQVIRILPVRTGDTHIQVYYEFHDFSRRAHIYDIVLNKRGDYARLADLYGQTLDQEWPESKTMDLKSAWHRFQRAYRKIDKEANEYVFGPIFFAYLNLYLPRSFDSDSDDQIIRNIRSSLEVLKNADTATEYEFLEEPSADSKQNRLQQLFSSIPRYTKFSPLKFAILYEADIEDSRWTDTHQAGLLYVGQMLGDSVKGSSYSIPDSQTGLADTLEKAVKDGNKVIFTITPDMVEETVRASLKYPNVRFLNCSLAMDADSIRCYNARMYEATFLMGVLAASTIQRISGPQDGHVIGYLADAPTKTTLASINAFAIGASLIDPLCRISLKWASSLEDSNYREQWKKERIRVFSDANSYSENEPDIFSSLYMIDDDEKKTYLGMPYYSWGRYYTKIIKSVMDGSYDAHEAKNEKSARSYWYGLSSGVVDVRLGREIPEQTVKLLALFKSAIMNGSFSPFTGPIRTTQSRVINPEEDRGKSTELRTEMETLQAEEIASIDWLYENIDGKIPGMDELTDSGKRLAKLMGN